MKDKDILDGDKNEAGLADSRLPQQCAPSIVRFSMRVSFCRITLGHMFFESPELQLQYSETF